MHKAKLFKKLAGKKVRCLACQRYCLIEQDKTGFCLARKNLAGELFSLNYGLPSSLQPDPIEKKPLYHFYPGSSVLSIGSWGCNFRCKQCLNWSCSWGKEATEKLKAKSSSFDRLRMTLSKVEVSKLKAEENDEKYVSPEKLVALVIENQSPGIAFTYNEPTIWPEYVYEAAKLAKEKNLYTVFVSNGSWSKETLALIGPVIDAANIDFKGWGEKVYQKQGAFWGKDFLKNLVLAKEKYQIHLELTTLIIPTINDQPKDLEAMADWIVKNLGPEIPWHLSRFSPALAPEKEFRKLAATPQKTLENAFKIAKKAGLHFVYVWATPEGSEEFFSRGDTFCPKCGRLVIKRKGWQPELLGVKKAENKGFCRFCGKDLYLRM